MTAQAVGGLQQAAQQAMSGQIPQAIQTALAALQQVAPSVSEMGNTIGSVLQSLVSK